MIKVYWEMQLRKGFPCKRYAKATMDCWDGVTGCDERHGCGGLGLRAMTARDMVARATKMW